MARIKEYRVVGSVKRGYAVIHQNNGIEYDNVEERAEAVAICAVLNSGIGPEWDVIEAHVIQKLHELHGSTPEGTKQT